MQYSFRWYGPKDPVKLTDIRQSNANYIVTSLHQIPTGEKWNFADVEDRINLINKANNDYANKLKKANLEINSYFETDEFKELRTDLTALVKDLKTEKESSSHLAVSYTHLTQPTNA